MSDVTEKIDPGDIDSLSYPTDEIPKYIREGLEKQDAESLHDIIAYSKHLLEQAVEEPPEEEVKEKIPDDANDVKKSGGRWVFQREVQCGDESCKCMTGNYRHGPYWYAAERNSDGTYEWDYIGKTLK